MCSCKQSSMGTATGVCVPYLHSSLHPQTYSRVEHAIKCGYACAYVSDISLHSPIDSYLCAYVYICILTLLKDCNSIRQLSCC